MKSWTAFLCIGSIAAVILAGCAQVPQQKLHEAEKSLDAARTAGAELYAFSQYKAAQVSLELAKKEISEEARKLPFMRSYKKITETLASAASAARSAGTAVQETKAKIRAETESILNDGKSLVDKIEAQLRKTPRKKTGTVAADLDSVKAAMKSADESLKTDNLLAAKEKASFAQDRVAALVKSLEKTAAPAKTARKKK
jgi:hypothetical protein